MSFGDGRSLSTSYDNRLRPTSWNVPNVLGFSYTYRGGYSDGGNNQVSYARNLSSNGGRDSTLDRSYEYDQVGALVVARSGAEARATFGIDGQGWGTSDGPYAHIYDYDKHGNMTNRYGWGGEVQGGAPYGHDTNIPYTYPTNKNQRDGLGYDAAGNVASDGYFNTYNASNQQTQAVNGNYILAQYYDGDGLRVMKYDNGPTTLYLRSTVLGGAVVEEIDANHNLARGYVYAGGDLLAVQQNSAVSWVHTDPVTKSQRTTDATGNVVNTVELDPWGANTDRCSSSIFQPQNFTSYIRDGNGQQDAMARRYSVGGRFSQPDPYGGSYNFSDPQSLNRYTYTKNDPVNRRDPSGLCSYAITYTTDASGNVTNYSVTWLTPCVVNSGGSGDQGAVSGFFGTGSEGMMIELQSDPGSGGGFAGNPFIQGRRAPAAKPNTSGSGQCSPGVGSRRAAPPPSDFWTLEIGTEIGLGVSGQLTKDRSGNYYLGVKPNVGLTLFPVTGSFVRGNAYDSNGRPATNPSSVRSAISGVALATDLTTPTADVYGGSWNTTPVRLGVVPMGSTVLPGAGGTSSSGNGINIPGSVSVGVSVTCHIPGTGPR